MKLNTTFIFNIIFIIVLFIIVFYNHHIFETKGYILTPEEYTITKVYSYHAIKFGRVYKIDITYEKDGIKYTSRCNVGRTEFNIIKKYFENISEDDAKNYLGNIKVYKNMKFTILKNEKVNN